MVDLILLALKVAAMIVLVPLALALFVGVARVAFWILEAVCILWRPILESLAATVVAIFVVDFVQTSGAASTTFYCAVLACWLFVCGIFFNLWAARSEARRYS